MKQVILFAVVSLTLVFGQGPPAWISSCIKQHGKPSRPSDYSQMTDEQKCFLNCMDTAAGDDTKGWLSGNEVKADNLPSFMKKYEEQIKSCAGNVSSTGCDVSFVIRKCLIDDHGVDVRPPVMRGRHK